MIQPGLWPREACRPTDSFGEMRVYTALKEHLPKGWYAWHSLKVRTENKWEGEEDFVVADPDRGILILEIKGGNITVRDGCWYSNGKAMDHAPRQQALSFAKKLLKRMDEHGCAPPAHGVANCFPDVAFEHGPTQDDIAVCVLGQQDLPWFGTALRDVMERALPPSTMARGQWIDELHRLWGETWVPRPSLAQRAHIEQDRRVKLEGQQLEILYGLADNRRLLVEGGAGCGKTILAREAAVRRASSGQRVLLLCFTDALAQWLSAQLTNPNLLVMTVKRLSAKLIREAGLHPPSSAGSNFWKGISLQAAVEAIPELAVNWDAVIIDEAQDFEADDWLLIDELSKDKCLWGFFDPIQAFWPDRKIPRELFQATFKLSNFYRCPSGVKALADACAGEPSDPAAIRDACSSGVVNAVVCPNGSSPQDRISAEVDKLCGANLKPQDIAILSLRGETLPESIVHRTDLNGRKLIRADDPTIEKNVIVETFLRFKGLERSAIIVTDLHSAQDKSDLGKRLYIALTRALVCVRIVAPRDDFMNHTVLKTLIR